MRLVALFFACNLIPLFSILHIFYRITRGYPEPAMAEQKPRVVILINIFIYHRAGILLRVLVSQNLSGPSREILKILTAIKNDRFDQRVHASKNRRRGLPFSAAIASCPLEALGRSACRAVTDQPVLRMGWLAFSATG